METQLQYAVLSNSVRASTLASVEGAGRIEESGDAFIHVPNTLFMPKNISAARSGCVRGHVEYATRPHVSAP